MNVGIIGGGQLAQMLALAGYPLGLRFVFLDPSPDACAASLGEHLQGDYDDPKLLRELAAKTDVITYEFENVPEQAVAFLAEGATVHPNANALATARDRFREKSLFRKLGLETAGFHPVDSLADLEKSVAELGLPAVLKTRTMGYDGKGQFVLREQADVAKAWDELGGVPLILEAFVTFDREISIIAVRNRGGDVRFYPISENIHREGILRTAWARPGDPAQQKAERYIRAVLDELDYVGVLTMELFQSGDELRVNEMAPRVHNSGHWTIEGAVVSQFENHLRAIVDLPLGDTGAVGYPAMVNFIGTVPAAAKVLELPGVYLHDYGKEPRPGRKLGHATVRTTEAGDLEPRVQQVLALT